MRRCSPENMSFPGLRCQTRIRSWRSGSPTPRSMAIPRRPPGCFRPFDRRDRAGKGKLLYPYLDAGRQARQPGPGQRPCSPDPGFGRCAASRRCGSTMSHDGGQDLRPIGDGDLDAASSRPVRRTRCSSSPRVETMPRPGPRRQSVEGPVRRRGSWSIRTVGSRHIGQSRGRANAICPGPVDQLGQRRPGPDEVARPAGHELGRSKRRQQPGRRRGIAVERRVGDPDLHDRVRVGHRDAGRLMFRRTPPAHCHGRRAERCGPRPSRPAARDCHRASRRIDPRIRSNGCGIPTRPPCSRAAATVSAADSPGGIGRSRKTQIRSPSSVFTSSPTMIVNPAVPSPAPRAPRRSGHGR